MYESQHSKIAHEHEGDTMVIHLNDSIKDDDTLKSQLLHLASHAHSQGVKNVLIKNENLGHPISNDFQQWAKMSIELPLLSAGVDKIAIVHPGNERLFALIHTPDTARKRYFASEAEARAWLG